MCTVSFLPLKDGTFCLTQNRDEAPHRSALKVTHKNIGGHEVHFPEDTGARGSWIALSNSGKVTCVLNGAFNKHKRNPPYRRSRGLILLDQFEYESTSDFVRFVNLNNIEPFTMLFADTKALTSLVWDGSRKHVETYDLLQSHLWASSTLYNNYWKERRHVWFEDWKKNNHANPENILTFHRTAGDGDPENDIVMNRGDKVCTTSITQIRKGYGDLQIHFLDIKGELTLSHSIATDR